MNLTYINKIAPQHSKVSCRDDEPTYNSAGINEDAFAGCIRCTLLRAAQPESENVGTGSYAEELLETNEFFGNLPTEVFDKVKALDVVGWKFSAVTRETDPVRYKKGYKVHAENAQTKSSRTISGSLEALVTSIYDTEVMRDRIHDPKRKEFLEQEDDYE